MSDRYQGVNIGGRYFGPTPQPPEGIGGDVADAAWRQANGSMRAYHMLLEEHAAGVINLLAGDQTRLTGPDHIEVAGGDPRLTATGGEVVGEPGQMMTHAPGTPQAPEPTATQVSPLSQSERDMLAELRGKSEAELTQSEAANLRMLSDREEALASGGGELQELRPLTVAERDRLATLRAMPEAEMTQPMHDEMADLIVRENIGR